MRRSLGTRVATFVFVVCMAVPAVAAPPRDDSPIGGFERAITHILKIVRGLIPTNLADLNIPKP